LTSYKFAISDRKCNGCGDCTIACPANTTGRITSEADENVILRVKNGKLLAANEDLCDGCGMCIEACPRHALQIKYKTAGEQVAAQEA
jgi:4Fe-4S ferredoxin